MIKLREEELKYISKKKNGILVKDTATYYFKEALEDGIELVIERLAKLVGINCPPYEMITIGWKKYYLSESISSGDNFFTFKELFINSKILSEIEADIRNFYPNNADYLIGQIIKIYLFDILVLNPDRRGTNIGLYFKNRNITDVYILDNECAFYAKRRAYLLSTAKKSNPDYDYMVYGIPAIARNIADLKYFLMTSDNLNLVKEMMALLSPEVVANVFSEVEQESSSEFFMKDVFINRYASNYAAIEKLLKISFKR